MVIMFSLEDSEARISADLSLTAFTGIFDTFSETVIDSTLAIFP